MNRVMLPTENKLFRLEKLPVGKVSFMGGIVEGRVVKLIENGDLIRNEGSFGEEEGSGDGFILVLNGTGNGYLDLVSGYLVRRETTGVISGFIRLMDYIGITEGLLVFPSKVFPSKMESYDRVNWISSDLKTLPDGKRIFTIYVDYRYPLDLYTLVLLAEGMVKKAFRDFPDSFTDEKSISNRRIYLSVSPRDIVKNWLVEDKSKGVGERYIGIIGEVGKPGVYRISGEVSYAALLETAGFDRVIADVKKGIDRRDSSLLGRMLSDTGEWRIVALKDNLWAGRIVENPEETIEEENSLILVLPRNHRVIKELETSLVEAVIRLKSVCNNCGYCTDFCPAAQSWRQLKPDVVTRQIDAGYVWNERVIEATVSCISCGVCNIVCPFDIQPLRIIDYVKKQLSPATDSDVEVKGQESVKRIPRDVFIERLGLSGYFAQVEDLWY